MLDMLSLIIHILKRICLQKQFLLLFFILLHFQAKSNSLKAIPIDIAISQELIGGCRQNITNEITFKIKVFRQDKMAQVLDEIVIKDSLNTNFVFISATTSLGTYNPNTGLWNNIQIAQGDTATLTLKVKIKSDYGGGTIHNEVWLQSMNCNFIDLDSLPNDKNGDDYAISTVSVPMTICSNKGEQIELTAPTGYTNYTWFKNDIIIANAKTNVLTVSSGGAYRVSINNYTKCTDVVCCPIYVDDMCVCLPMICLPFKVIKSKKK
jgi:Domain of unknown function DUF11